jgi:hypothetical protein
MGRDADRPPQPLRTVIAPAWPWFLTASLVGYSDRCPGVVRASRWGWANEVLVLGAVAFGGFALALVAAPADDRLQTAGRRCSP